MRVSEAVNYIYILLLVCMHTVPVLFLGRAPARACALQARRRQNSEVSNSTLAVICPLPEVLLLLLDVIPNETSCSLYHEVYHSIELYFSLKSSDDRIRQGPLTAGLLILLLYGSCLLSNPLLHSEDSHHRCHDLRSYIDHHSGTACTSPGS